MLASQAFPRWPAALGTTVVWVLAAASVLYWGLRLATPRDASLPPPVGGAAVAIDSAQVAKALGAPGAQPAGPAAPTDTRLQLLGVIADETGGGAALISVDGQPARPFRVGQTVGRGYVLQSLDARAAALGADMDAKTGLTLKLPDPPMVQGGIVQR